MNKPIMSHPNLKPKALTNDRFSSFKFGGQDTNGGLRSTSELGSRHYTIK